MSMPDGTVAHIPRGRAKLRLGIIPCTFPNVVKKTNKSVSSSHHIEQQIPDILLKEWNYNFIAKNINLIPLPSE